MSEPRALVPPLATDSCAPIPAEERHSLASEGQAISTSRADGSTSFFEGSSGFEIHNSHFVVDNRTVYYDYRVLPPAGQAEVDRVLKMIPKSKFRAIQDENMAKRTPETGRVIIESAFFQKWLSDDQTTEVWILWGIGIPGAGKTLLAALVIDTLEQSAKANPRISVAYAYFRYTERPSLGDILTALVRQQVESHHNLAPLVEPLFAQRKRENREPSEDDLVGLLQSIARHFDQTFYSLDGLDEAPREMYIKIVTTVLKIKSVKLWMTSRPLKDIEDAIPNVHLFTVKADEADIRRFVEEQLGYEPGLAKLVDRYGREDFIRTIQNKAGGMFLHATLQMNALRHALNLRSIQKQLDGTPHDIVPLYANTLGRINDHPSGKNVAKLGLAFLVFRPPTVKKPLTLTDLQWALAFDEDTQEFDPDLIIPEDRLLPLFCGLVTVERKSRVVRLVHYTAQDILRPILAQEFHLPQLMVLKVCLARLRVFGVHNDGLRDGLVNDVVNQPLLAYSYDAWAPWAHEVLEDATGRDTVFEFVSECSAFTLLHPNWSDKSYILSDILSPAHVAALHNLTDALRRLFNPPPSDAELNALTTTNRQSPLIFASGEGNIESVEFLLTIPGVDINLCDIEQGSPLLYAVQRGQIETIRVLLAATGIQSECLNQGGQTPLMLAAKRGDGNIVQMLLDTPAVNAERLDREGWSALMIAASRGHKDVMRILLNVVGVKPDRTDREGWSSMMLAASFGYHEIVGLLLDTPGVDPNRVDTDGRSSIMLACQNGKPKIVQLLLGASVKTDIANKQGQTAVMLAALYGHLACLQLLSKVPEVDLDCVDIHGRSALMLAARNGHKRLVQYLLESGKVDAHRVDLGGQTASGLAAERGHSDIVELLPLSNTPEAADTGYVEEDYPTPTTAPPSPDANSPLPESTTNVPTWATSNPFPTHHFVPAEMDVFTTHGLLLSKLPIALVERILDEAECWPQLFAQQQSTPPIHVIAAASANGLASRCYFVSPPLPTRCVLEDTTAHVRRVVFRTWSHDQGWGGEATAVGPYGGSFTWFEAAIFRGLPEGAGEDPEVLAQLVQEPSREGQPAAESEESQETGPPPPLQVPHPLTKEIVWGLQRNMRAFFPEVCHEIVWDLGPESGLVEAESVAGWSATKGAGSGQGFVRELQAGDRIAIFAKAQYMGWVNYVSGAAVQVFYSPFKVPEPAVPVRPCRKLDSALDVECATPVQGGSPLRRLLNVLGFSLVYVLSIYISIDPRCIFPSSY